MVKVGLFVRLQAKPGKEAVVASFLESALDHGEPGSRHARLVRAAAGAIDFRYF